MQNPRIVMRWKFRRVSCIFPIRIMSLVSSDVPPFSVASPCWAGSLSTRDWATLASSMLSCSFAVRLWKKITELLTSNAGCGSYMPILIKSKTCIANSDRASVRWLDARLNSICEVRLACSPLRDTQLILNVERRDALMQCNDLLLVSSVPDCFVREIDNLYHFLSKRHQQHNC
jgi:hypothetical protein